MSVTLDWRWQKSLEVNLLGALAGLGYRPDGEEFVNVRNLIRLPHGCMFFELTLAPGDDSICLGDLRDYYYLLRWPPAMMISGVVVPP